ncbi:MAG: tetratricopeptide repeat protein [Candidatus Rokubacteria bacterium]|nr:tetratricopeptide repeat protein [Candidatus Rokubacteria bacterium]
MVLRCHWTHLALIVFVGALLRFWGILHGLRDGFIYHPDADAAVHDAWHHYLGAAWGESQFGATYNFLLVLAMRVVDAVGRFVGYPPAWSFGLIAATSSLVTAMLGTATVPAVYVVGAYAYGRPAGLLAAAFFAVCPLHSFHSHYPYRDVPMVFFLVLTLLGCLRIAERPTVLVFLLTGLAAAVTAALKPAGFAIAAPLLTASVLAVIRVRGVRAWVGIVALVAVGLLALPLFLRVQFGSPGLAAFWFGSRLLGLAGHVGGFSDGALAAFGVLVDWLGVGYVAAVAAGTAYGLWRHGRSDLVVLSLLLPGFAAAAVIPWFDERFLVFLLPVGAVMVGRATVEWWQAGRRLRPARVALGLTVGALLGTALLQSAWQGILLSLPDTRVLAGRWLEAHVPRSARVAVEGYYPVGLDEWPNLTFFDSREPFRLEAAKADFLVTSSLEHQRYFDHPERFPKELTRQILAFFGALRQEANLVRSFALVPLGFVDPTIDIYSTELGRNQPLPRLLLPRPYDAKWNAGVSFLDAGPYDRDDRTIHLSGAQRYTATLVGHEPVDEVVVFVLNGPGRSVVRVRVGWTSKTLSLQPDEWRAIRFRPRWVLPTRPALYRFEVGLVYEGTQALVQLRSGAREIGEAYTEWGRWEAAIPYLERAAGATPSDRELQFLLAGAYRKVGRVGEARRVVERLAAEAPEVLEQYRRLGQTDTPPGTWERVFRQATGLEPSLLSSALGEEFEAEHLVLRYGRIVRDPAASGGLSVAFEKEKQPAGVIVDGPYIYGLPGTYIARGAYRARFALRAWGWARLEPLATLRVSAAGRLLASRPVTSRDLAASEGFAEIVLPFVHDDQSARVAFEVEATGHASLAIDGIRIEPDLRETFRERMADSDAAAAGRTGRPRPHLVSVPRRPGARPTSEERVDEGGDGARLGEDHEGAHQEQSQDHRREPPPLVLPEEDEQLARDAQAAGESLDQSHPQFFSAGFSITQSPSTRASIPLRLKVR